MIFLAITGGLVILSLLVYGVFKFSSTFTAALNDAREYRKLKDKE